jgi:hypothetical protein
MDRRQLLKTMPVLLGMALSPSCRRALESAGDLAAVPRGGRLSAAQMGIIAVLAELIIPRTDTPGATDAGVPAFIEQIVVDWYTETERQIFLEGLAELESGAERNWSAPFLGLDRERQAQLLSELEPPLEGLLEAGPLESVALAPGAAGELQFFVKLKELCVLGYYTSAVAANTELSYRPVPGRYVGDALFEPRGRQWAH